MLEPPVSYSSDQDGLFSPNSAFSSEIENKTFFITLTHSGKEFWRLDFFREDCLHVFGEVVYDNYLGNT
jgi:hypothetical protein